MQYEELSELLELLKSDETSKLCLVNCLGTCWFNRLASSVSRLQGGDLVRFRSANKVGVLSRLGGEKGGLEKLLSPISKHVIFRALPTQTALGGRV